MHAFLRLVTCGLLAWQAAATVVQDVRGLGDGAIDWHLLLAADTDTRLRAALGDDAELLIALRAAIPPGQVVLNRAVPGTPDDLRAAAPDEAAFQRAVERLAARTLLFLQMSHLLYPEVRFVTLPDPVAVLEDGVQGAPDALLFVLAGDPPPTDRAGWSCTTRTERFQLWRFRKA